MPDLNFSVNIAFARPNDGDEMEKLTINARETAPSFATQDMYVNDSRKSSVVGKNVKKFILVWKVFANFAIWCHNYVEVLYLVIVASDF